MSNVRGQDMSNLVYGAQMVKTSKMGGYGQTAEADAAAIAAVLNNCLSPGDNLSRTRISCDNTCVRLNGKPVITVQPEDLALQ